MRISGRIEEGLYALFVSLKGEHQRQTVRGAKGIACPPCRYGECGHCTGLVAETSRGVYFNPDNAFDAEGLTRLTQKTQQWRKQRNDIEQDTEVQVRSKNLEASRQELTIG